MSDSNQVNRLAPHHYIFRSEWNLPFHVDSVFAALADLSQYPAWWPQFKSAELIGSDRASLALRSALPLTLRFTLQREVEDAAQHRLRARAIGDIDGTVEWTVHPTAARSARAEFVQDVLLRHAIATKLDRAIRPILEWNHRVAMTSGAAGLTRYLSQPRP